VQDALALVDGWPVPHAAAGVLDPNGTMHVRGDPDQPFPLASVTKLLTAVAVLVATEEGSLDVDEPVPLPAGATARDLLCHASGLAPEHDQVVAPPRRRRIYSTRGYELLAEVVTARTRMPFDVYLREAVLEPLGMSATALRGSAGSGAVSTVGDLLRFAVALRRPQILSEASLAAYATAQFPALDGVLPGFGVQRPNPWGLGPEIRGAKSPHWTGTRNAPSTHGHFGRAGTFLWIDPVASISAVVLTDRDFDDWARTAWPELSDAIVASWVV
jgi:CubicO group peptidase (beta-lactamase class C family)